MYAYFGDFSWPNSHDPFPWQPGFKVTSLIPVFDFLHLKTHLVQISSKSETIDFHDL